MIKNGFTFNELYICNQIVYLKTDVSANWLSISFFACRRISSFWLCPTLSSSTFPKPKASFLTLPYHSFLSETNSILHYNSYHPSNLKQLASECDFSWSTVNDLHSLKTLILCRLHIFSTKLFESAKWYIKPTAINK